MNLINCLHSLCGYGINIINREGRLVIQSATYTLTTDQAACLKAHKPLLLSILPVGTGQIPGALMDAVEAYTEREAIMSESGVPVTTIDSVATAQARCVLKLITP